MAKIDLKIWIIYICIAVAVALLITSCSSTKKNISTQKTETDSSSVTAKKATGISTTDTYSTKKDSAAWTKETTFNYIPVWVPKGTIAPGYVMLPTNSPDTMIILVPSINIKETGNSKKEEKTEEHKKDSTAAYEKIDTQLKKKEVVKKRNVDKERSIPWYVWPILLIVLVVAVFLEERFKV